MSVHERPAPNPRARERRVTSRKDADFWITPRWATEALLDREILPRCVWEPACGDGAMARVLQDRGIEVVATDLHDRGFIFGRGRRDFLLEREMPQREDEFFSFRPTAIVTNPPFSLLDRFIEHAHSLAPRKICFFAPTGALSGQKRGAFYTKHPWSRVWIFSRRVTLLAGELAVNGVTEAPAEMRGNQNFAWFVMEKHAPGGTQIGWIP